MDEATVNATPIPWYRTRRFWGIVFSLILMCVIINFYLFTSGISAVSTLTAKQVVTFLVLSSGAAFFILAGASLGKIGVLISGLLYYLIAAFCVYQTLRQNRVKVRYPIILILLFGSGVIVGMMYASGL